MADKAISISRKGAPDGSPVDRAICNDIAAAIFEQRMPPGTKLSEARLGDLYGVSRTIVRKALIRLASDKLVEIRPNRGASVAQPTVAEAHEVFQARRVIEPALLVRCVRAMTPEKKRRLKALLSDDQAANANHQRGAMIHASGSFHLGLAEMSGNAVLYGFLDQLVRRTSIIIAMYGDRINSACSHDAHAELADLVARGDSKAGEAAMLQHLYDCEKQLNLSGARPETDLAAMLGVAHPKR